jgi:hypothetical protein
MAAVANETVPASSQELAGAPTFRAFLPGPGESWSVEATWTLTDGRVETGRIVTRQPWGMDRAIEVAQDLALAPNYVVGFNWTLVPPAIES